MKAIVLIGHDDITGLSEARFRSELEKAILAVAEVFYSGGQGGIAALRQYERNRPPPFFLPLSAAPRHRPTFKTLFCE